MSSPARKPPVRWAIDAPSRRHALDQCLDHAGKQFKAATGDERIWPFFADAAVHLIGWLITMDTRTVPHPSLKGFTTSVHGDRVEPLLKALIAVGRAKSVNGLKAAEARVTKHQRQLVASILDGADQKIYNIERDQK